MNEWKPEPGEWVVYGGSPAQVIPLAEVVRNPGPSSAQVLATGFRPKEGTHIGMRKQDGELTWGTIEFFRPLALSEVTSEEMARQFYGKEFVTPGNSRGKIVWWARNPNGAPKHDWCVRWEGSGVDVQYVSLELATLADPAPAKKEAKMDPEKIAVECTNQEEWDAVIAKAKADGWDCSSLPKSPPWRGRVIAAVSLPGLGDECPRAHWGDAIPGDLSVFYRNRCYRVIPAAEYLAPSAPFAWPGGFRPGERVWVRSTKRWATVLDREEKHDRIGNLYLIASAAGEVPIRFDVEYAGYLCWHDIPSSLSRTGPEAKEEEKEAGGGNFFITTHAGPVSIGPQDFIRFHDIPEANLLSDTRPRAAAIDDLRGTREHPSTYAPPHGARGKYHRDKSADDSEYVAPY